MDNQPQFPIWLQVISFSLALVGALFSALNSYASLVRDRVKLKIVPKAYIEDPNGFFARDYPDEKDTPEWSHVCIEVINLGMIPVTISEVGFLLSDTSKARIVVKRPAVMDGKPFPRRLEPRESVTVYGTLSAKEYPRISKAYAGTACGVIAKGTSPFLKNIIKLART